MHGAYAEDRHVEAQRGERARVRADAEESDVTEAQLPGVAEQQVETHRGDREDARGDEDVQEIRLGQPQRDRREQRDGRIRRGPH